MSFLSRYGSGISVGGSVLAIGGVSYLAAPKVKVTHASFRMMRENCGGIEGNASTLEWLASRVTAASGYDTVNLQAVVEKTHFFSPKRDYFTRIEIDYKKQSPFDKSAGKPSEPLRDQIALAHKQIKCIQECPTKEMFLKCVAAKSALNK